MKGEPCVCENCSTPWESCDARKIKNSKLVLLAKLKKAVWIER